MYLVARRDHLLYCLRPDDVLPWRDAVGHW